MLKIKKRIPTPQLLALIRISLIDLTSVFSKKKPLSITERLFEVGNEGFEPPTPSV